MNSRLDLPKLITPIGVGIELGVAKGYYSDIILQKSKLKCLYSIDRWNDSGHPKEEYLFTKRLLSKYGKRSIVLLTTFQKALLYFRASESFDFIYIDGYAHEGQEDGETLYDWYPKVKAGGIFAGHDYTNRYPQTIEAVDTFCKSIGQIPIIIPGDSTTGNQQDEYESWYVVKE